MNLMNKINGQYKNNNSLIQKIDPRLKLYYFIFYVILTLIFHETVPFILSFIAAVSLLYLSKIDLIELVKAMHGGLIIFGLFTILSALAFSSWQPILLLLRLIFIMTVAIVFSKTTKPYQVLDALKEGLHLSEELSMTIAIAFGFLPSLANEMERLKTAAASRGADIREANFWIRIRDFIPLITPLFKVSIDKAAKLADAMDVRNYYDDNERTEVFKLEYKKIDRYAALVLGAYAAIVIVAEIFF